MMMIPRYDNYIEGIFLKKSPYLLKVHITIVRDKNMMELGISLSWSNGHFLLSKKCFKQYFP